MDAHGFEVGCRVVCIDTNFHEIVYRLCQAIPRLDGVYTVSELVPNSPQIITNHRDLGLRLRELPLPLWDGRRPTWAWWRFQRLDDSALMRFDEEALLEPVLVRAATG
jgi:hypothetical protein